MSSWPEPKPRVRHLTEPSRHPEKLLYFIYHLRPPQNYWINQILTAGLVDSINNQLCKMILSCAMLFAYFNVYFLERERERETVWAGEGQRERETLNLKQALGSELSAQSPLAGLEPRNRKIMIWAEVRCLTNWATWAPHQSTLIVLFICCSFWL